jgi:hypothetical protein
MGGNARLDKYNTTIHRSRYVVMNKSSERRSRHVGLIRGGFGYAASLGKGAQYFRHAPSLRAAASRSKGRLSIEDLVDRADTGIAQFGSEGL